ncbi:MAG TPA: PQQ-dependent sugar dehydrogenase [Kofleriaceae bacterium]|nr:PQQ-dependent sugar dehydrogenase [Kofleriaceae bacterium]
MRTALVAALFVVVACGGSDKPPPPAPDEVLVVPRCEAPVSGTTVTMRKIGRVVGAALLVTSPPDDRRLFVIEQRGTIRIFNEDEILLPDPFLDLSADAAGPVVAGGENGLLGLAFHPQYATNHQFFITYTTTNPGDATNPQRDVLVRCTASADNPNRADASSCTDVLSIPDFASNHNGGMIEFGADGYLYWATGDGGGAGDPNQNGQAIVDGSPLPNTHALLGKMLRLDVDNKTPGKEYGIPADNPFAAGGGLPEIFIIGLRNAWRWSFDRATGDMWIADVGQATIEELTVLTPDQQKGANLGWSMYEGSLCFREPCGGGTILPQEERTHAEAWVSITGGQVYRGSCFPDLVGTYFYTDYGKGGLAKATFTNGTLAVSDLDGTYPGHGASLHADARGELYETDTDGNVYHLEVAP